LTKDLPAGLSAAQRVEADSKFFQSFFVVLGALSAIYALRQQEPAARLGFIGMLPAPWRYIDWRCKATQQAYWFVFTLDAERAKPAPVPRDDRLTHAGGVVYRETKGTKSEVIEFMLVEASKNREEEVLPKGHIEPGEGPRVTTVREVREETGHWAKEGLARRRPTRRKGRCPVCRLVSAGAVQRAEGEATRRAATPLASCRCNRAGATGVSRN